MAMATAGAPSLNGLRPREPESGHRSSLNRIARGLPTRHAKNSKIVIIRRDLTSATWRKSSRSTTNGGNCVEVADLDDSYRAVRDSKTRPAQHWCSGQQSGSTYWTASVWAS